MTAHASRPLLVVGAGIAGITAALEAAEAGREVVLVERDACVGGRVLRNHHYFPKLCPPSCGMEINTRRLERNSRVRVITRARVTGCRASDGGYEVTITHAPAYVNDRCTACGDCTTACPARVKDPFNLDMSEVPAIRLPHPNAWPKRFVLDRAGVSRRLSRVPRRLHLRRHRSRRQGAHGDAPGRAPWCVATGWDPYPLERLPELGGGLLPDVIANVHMERMAAPAGPTGGKILRPSDQQPPKRVAFVQCAGSRDVNHLAYCSAVCCLASLKQAIYVKEQLPDAEVTIYYIDRRTPGRNEEMLTRVAAMDGVRLVKGKVAKVERNGSALVLRVEDVEAGRIVHAEADLVVLATGMVPSLGGDARPLRPRQRRRRLRRREARHRGRGGGAPARGRCGERAGRHGRRGPGVRRGGKERVDGTAWRLPLHRLRHRRRPQDRWFDRARRRARRRQLPDPSVPVRPRGRRRHPRRARRRHDRRGARRGLLRRAPRRRRSRSTRLATRSSASACANRSCGRTRPGTRTPRRWRRTSSAWATRACPRSGWRSRWRRRSSGPCWSSVAASPA